MSNFMQYCLNRQKNWPGGQDTMLELESNGCIPCGISVAISAKGSCCDSGNDITTG